MEILIGIISGLVIILTGKLTGFERNRRFYPAILIVIGLLYILFGFIDGRFEIIVFESLFAAIFIGIAFVGLKKSLLIAAVGIFLHGVFDVTHNLVIENSGVPSFYPQFCLTVDFVLAIYLGLTQFTKSEKR